MVKARLAATREARGRARAARAAGDRPHDVRRHDALRAAAHRGAEGRVRLPRVPRDRRRRPVDGEAGRRRPAPGRDRHHHHRGLRPADGRRVSRDRRPLRRDHPRAHSLCRLGRRARHGQLRPARHRAGALSGPPAPSAQSASDADAHHAGRERADGPLDRRAAEPDGCAGALPAARGRRVGARQAGRRLLRPGGGCGAVPRARTDRAADLDAPARARAGAHQRSGVRGRRARRLPGGAWRAHRRAAGRRGSHAVRTLRPDGEIPRHGGARRADRRRRRRHGPLGEVRGGRRHRPDRDLQFRPLPHGRARLARRPDGLRRCQRRS